MKLDPKSSNKEPHPSHRRLFQRHRSKPEFPPECLYVSFRQLRTFRRMSRWARSATSGLSAGLLGETQLTRDLVFDRKRAQFVPGRVLDLDADLATFLLPQIFDLARIKHAVRAFGRWRRFEVTRELGDLFLEVL